MTVKETDAFMREIKAYYPDFPIEKYLIDQWSLKLQKYDLLKAKQAFENHKIGSMKEKAPTLKYFIACYEKSKQNYLGKLKCRYCGKVYETLEEVHECQDFCRSKKYILKISSKLDLNLKDIFGVEELTREAIGRSYKKFLYRAYKENQQMQTLNEQETKGLEMYYQNVLLPMLERKQNEH